MALPTLTNPKDPAFDFEHWMAHTNNLGVMSPLTRFVLPYFLMPSDGAADEAGDWRFNHQVAHDDANANLPSGYGSLTVGLPMGANLVDGDLNDSQALSWWSFQNFQEHLAQANSILPPPAPGQTWTYPFTA